MTDEQKQLIRDGKIAIYLLGDIEYIDIFGKERITTFRYACGAGYIEPPEGVGGMMVCEKGNDAT